jgi:hypothetical protein
MPTIRKIALILICHLLIFCVFGYEEILRYIEHGVDIHIFSRHTNYNFYLGFYVISLVLFVLPLCTILLVRNRLKKIVNFHKTEVGN